MTRASLRSAATVVAAVLVVGGVGAGLLPAYWIYIATAVLITAVSLLSLGIVEGRTGMISLCQLSFAGVGAWTVGYLNVAGAPGGLPLWVLIGGLAAMPLGVAIGLPALRLRGINLAIVTLGFASAFDAILAANTFPGQTQFLQVPRPDGFDSDEGYFLFVLAVFALIAGVLKLVAPSRLGARPGSRSGIRSGPRLRTVSAFPPPSSRRLPSARSSPGSPAACSPAISARWSPTISRCSALSPCSRSRPWRARNMPRERSWAVCS